MSEWKRMSADVAYVEVHGRELQNVCHDRAKAAGWWDDLGTGELFTKQQIVSMVPTKLLLVVSEVCEGMEGHRKGLPDDKLPHRDALEVELADALIRIYDLGGALGYDLGAAMAEKLRYNATRPDHTRAARKASGGKAY